MPDDDLDVLLRHYRHLTPAQYTRVHELAVERAKTLRGELLRDLLRQFLSWRRRRAAIAELSALDDQALKDIGLPRCGIEAAVRGDVVPPRVALPRMRWQFLEKPHLCLQRTG